MGGEDRRMRLRDARLYLCTDSRREQGDLEEFLDEVLRAGVDIVQLREKGLEARDEIELAETFGAMTRKHGALFSINDRADIAWIARPDVLHLGQNDLPVPDARWLLGRGVLIGRSTHDEDQAEDAMADPAVDYFCVGPTWETPTKPGRPAAGLDLLRYVAGRTPKPWFAIGGINLDNLDEVLAAGARRVVVVRAITEADDPAAATAAFTTRLHTAGS